MTGGMFRSPAARGWTAALLLCGAAWTAAARAGDADAAALDRGRMLFTGGATPACAICHTLADADATGAVGPSLDELKPDAARVANVLRKGMGVMPSYAALGEDDIAALAAYVAQAAAKP
jgi:mono/diheme cytochrome c family protein